MKKLAVVLGRFQPFHDQHLYLVESAFDYAEKVLIVIGSINQPRTPKNPFTFEERKHMIELSLEEAGIDLGYVYIEGVEDYVEDTDWVHSIEGLVVSVEPNISNASVELVGHSKDESSYYLKSFPEWSVVDIPMKVELDATTIRNQWYSHPSSVTDVACDVYDYLQGFWLSSNDWYNEVAEQDAHNKREKDKLMKGYPYPQSLNVCTSDAVVSCYGKHLLIKRKENPYKGCWALAGGHKDSNETFLQCALRELDEETSLGLTVDDNYSEKMFDNPKRDPVCTKVSMCYWFGVSGLRYEDGTLPVVTPKDDAIEAKWFTTEEVIDMKGNMAFDHYEMLTHFLNL